MAQLDVVCDLGISFNVHSSWMSWALDIEIISAIIDESDFIWTLGWCHWKGHLIRFSCICIISNSDFVCILYINLNERWS
jgi:hypothetical protein